jgi:phytoene dehydrogenase-like protein
LRLLGGRFAAEHLHSRLHRWKLFDPIVIASWGVSNPMSDQPPMLLVDGVGPTEIAGRQQDGLYLRIYNDDPAFAPPGHTVVQLMCPSDYDWWAKRGGNYHDTKAEVAAQALELTAKHMPGLAGAVEMTDIATPLTFWRAARSWRGAFEGWIPSSDDYTVHIPKTLPRLDNFYMAGQWVEPGGGVPTSLMSGRQLVQILCDAQGRTFQPTG